MLSSGIFSASQFWVHLNEASTSLGNLKKCLCSSPGCQAIKSCHSKIASVLSSTPKVQSYEASIFPLEIFPEGWLKDVKIANTKLVGKERTSLSTVLKTSHISAESFLLNKHGMFQPLEARWMPLYSQRMVTDRKLFIQDIQKRLNSTYTSNKRLIELERIANRDSDDAVAQAEYLKLLLREDPELLIRRYESNRFSNNKETNELYTKALVLTDRLSLSEAMKQSSKNMRGMFNNKFEEWRRSGGSKKSQEGSKNQPLHVVVGISKFYLFLYIAIPLMVLYTVVSRISGTLNSNHKEILPDQSDKKYKFADVQGCNEAKEELEEVVQFLKHPEQFEKLGAKLPRGILLIGQPGTGKTLLARAIAGEADVPFFFVSGSEFDEMFVGVGAARVRKLFTAAKEHSPCIVFVDELDAIGGKRSKNDNQPYSRMTLNQLLVELDGFDQSEGIIVIGATNFPEILDHALTRPGRFDSKVFVTMPDVRGRIDILNLYLDKIDCKEGVDVEVLARSTVNFSGADLMNLVNQAALHAASLQMSTITMEHFTWARDKIMMGPERKSAFIEEENRKLTAYHEGGHAIVAIFTKDADPVHKATVVPRGQALGYVMQLPEKDNTSRSRKQLLARMDVCMGGRVAEEMIFGEDSITTGASSDMEQASDIARMMVTKWGMSDKVGTVTIDETGDSKVSPELQNVIESEVKRLVQEAYLRAKKILKTYSTEHKRLAEGLLKYETLDSKEIDLVIKGFQLENKL